MCGGGGGNGGSDMAAMALKRMAAQQAAARQEAARQTAARQAAELAASQRSAYQSTMTSKFDQNAKGALEAQRSELSTLLDRTRMTGGAYADMRNQQLDGAYQQSIGNRDEYLSSAMQQYDASGAQAPEQSFASHYDGIGQGDMAPEAAYLGQGYSGQKTARTAAPSASVTSLFSPRGRSSRGSGSISNAAKVVG